MDIPHIAAKNSFADAVIGNIILLIRGKYLLSLQILPLHLIEQVCLTAFQPINIPELIPLHDVLELDRVE